MDVVHTLSREPAMNVEVRPPIAILSVGPHRSDVTAMVDELERQSQPVTFVCLDGAKHEHEGMRADVIQFPSLSLAILSSVALRLTRDPLRILRCLRLLTPSSLRHLPAAIHLARVLPGRGIADVRAFDPVASRVASVVRRLCDTARPDLAELPVDWSRLNAHRIGVRWFSRRINCIAAELSIDGDDRRVIVKRQRPDAMRSAADRAGHEYRVLRSLAETIVNEVLTVPRVLLFDEEAAILVMERAEGARFDTMFGVAAEDHGMIEQLADGVRGAGRWLAAMQTATRRSADGSALLAEVVATAVDDAAKMAARDRAVARQHRRIVHSLRTLEHGLRRRPMIVAGHHGDYWPGNVFFDGQRVTVIDFEGFRDGLWLEDIAYFLIRSDMLRRRFRLPLPDLEKQFFEGYAPGQQPDLEALRLFNLTKGLRTLANGTGDDLPLPQRIWTRRSIRTAVFDAMRDQP